MTPQAPTTLPTPAAGLETNGQLSNGKASPAGSPSRLPRARRLDFRTKLFLIAGGGGLLLLAGLVGFSALSGLGGVRPDLVLHTVRLERLALTIVERGTLESAENKDITCRVKAKSQGSNVASSIKSIIDDGSHVKGPHWPEDKLPAAAALTFGAGFLVDAGPLGPVSALLAHRKLGDVLAELDDSGLQEQLKAQQIVVERARNDLFQAQEKVKIDKSQNDSDIENAKTGIALALLAVEQYLDGDYPQATKDIKNRMLIAESDLDMWRDRVISTDRMVKKDYYSPSQAQADRAKMQSAEVALQRVQEELRVLERFTYRMRKTELESKSAEAKRNLDRVMTQASSRLEQAENDFDTKRSIYEKEQDKYQDILEEISKCVIHAPQDGMVVYFVSESSRYGGGGSSSSQGIVAQGEFVREGQKLMRLPNLARMQVNARVHEAMVARVKENQPAYIRTDAFPDKQLHGRVKFVAPVAAAAEFMSSDIKVYQTLVAIDESVEGLRPGMSAEITIHTEAALENVLAIPVQAVVGAAEMGSTRECFVVTANGVEKRTITLGLSNDKMAEVKKGLEAGDQVVVNPKVLVGDKGVKVRHLLGSDKAAPADPAAGKSEAAPDKNAEEKKGAKGGKEGKGKGGSPEERQKRFDDFRKASPAERKAMLDQVPEAYRDKFRQGLQAQGIEIPN